MIWLVALGCTDPVVRSVDTIAVPQVAAAAPRVANVRIGVTTTEVFLDPGTLAGLAPMRVLGLGDAQEHELALPALVAALEPVREALGDERFAPEVVIGADVPYRAAVRVLYSIGMAMGEGVWIAVATPSGPGVVELPLPGACGDDPPMDRCVTSVVEVADGGIELTLDEILGDRPRCTTIPVRSEPTPDGDWRGKRVVRAPGICPTLQGHDPQGLTALLERTTALGPPCGTAAVSASDGTPWGDVVPLWLAVRARHGTTFLAIAPADRDRACGDGFSL